ncbi:MAG: hypothetical protein KBB14_01550 [Thermoanaerobaculia bacterium]|nr:hypothetical protein [Thermoanaerobaculia bacterium]
MTSSAKEKANRENALRSTGPKTAEGKSASSKNAMRHGLLSREVVLPDEDPAELEEFRRALSSELKPVGEVESLLVDRIVFAAWRLRRAGRLEAAIVRREILTLDAARVEHEASRGVDDFLVSPLGLLGKKGEEALERKRALEAQRDADRVSAAIVRDATNADVLGRLRRYEVALERGLYRGLHELERIQRSRRGEHVAPPAVLEIHGEPEP